MKTVWTFFEFEIFIESSGEKSHECISNCKFFQFLKSTDIQANHFGKTSISQTSEQKMEKLFFYPLKIMFNVCTILFQFQSTR